MAVPDQINKALASDEEILYNFEKPLTLKPPGLVFTNKRLIYYKPKTFGIELKDYSWHDLCNVSMKEGLVQGEIEFEMAGNHDIEFENVSKDQVRKMYALAQELKAKAHNALHKPQVIVQQEAKVPQEDPVVKLKQLKDMLDGGLISQAEYDAKKADILSRM